MESAAGQPVCATGRRFHPAMSRRIIASSSDPTMLVHAGWQMTADLTEQLEAILQTFAALQRDVGIAGPATPQSRVREQGMQVAVIGVRHARAMMEAHGPNDPSSDCLPPAMIWLLSRVSKLMDQLAGVSTTAKP